MPADNTITLEGKIVGRDAQASQGPGPGRFRMSTYCAGSNAKDNLKVAFISVKQFDMDIHAYTKGTKVRVVGRFDPWEDKDGNQVLDVMVDDKYNDQHGITIVTDDQHGSHQPQRQAQPAYQDEAY